MTLEQLFQLEPYSLEAADKEIALSEILSERTRFHYANCPEYKAILDKLSFDPTSPLPSFAKASEDKEAKPDGFMFFAWAKKWSG